MPSKDDGLDFTAFIRLDWRRDLEARAPASPQAAACAVRTLIEPITAHASVLRVTATEQQLAARLIDQLPLRRAGVEILQAHITLSVEDTVLQAAERLQQQRQEMSLDELARRQAKARAEFMRTEILQDPATARLYALLDLPAHLTGPKVQDDLERLVHEINLWRPESRWISIAKIINSFIEQLPDTSHAELLSVLCGVLRNFGADQDATRVLDIMAAPPSAPDPKAAWASAPRSAADSAVNGAPTNDSAMGSPGW